MRTIIITICILFLSYQLSLAEDTEIIKHTTLKVKLIDKDLNAAEDPMISIVISAYPFGAFEFLTSKDSVYEQLAVKGGNIFNISSPSDVFYMLIYYQGIKIPYGSCYQIDNIYIIKAGSELTIELDRYGINFSGKGATIPNIQSQITQHAYTTLSSDLKLLNTKEYLRYFQKLDKSRDSALQLQLQVIESNKAVLGDFYTKVLTANCYGYRYYAQLSGYQMQLRQNDAFFKTFKKYYYEKLNVRNMPRFTNEILDAAPMFANYLMEEINILEKIGYEEYGPQVLPDSCISNILQKINSEYKGTFRDKLLTLFAFRTEKNRNALPFFDGILDSVKTKRYHDLLVNKIKIRQNGNPFRAFKLQDEHGKVYTLDHFKNKVVVLDFWYTGCINCIKLTDYMKPVYAHFKGNNRVQFVSISIDKSKDEWLKSIQGGKYTHPESINLYTNGEEDRHDLIKYYNITSYPKLFVIKNGKMESSLPPRPGGRDKEVTELIELLEKALKQ